MPGAQKLTWSLGKFSIGFARVSVKLEGTDGFLLPPPGAALKMWL